MGSLPSGGYGKGITAVLLEVVDCLDELGVDASLDPTGDFPLSLLKPVNEVVGVRAHFLKPFGLMI